MAKKKQNISSSNSIVEGILKEIELCRPSRIYINKQRKKGNQTHTFNLRTKYLQLSLEKQAKYIQKSINKYIELLDEKNVSEQNQIEGKLFEILLSKKEQKFYFDSINAPKKPLNTAAAYYSDEKKNETSGTAKAWKTLTTDEKKPYLQMLHDGKTDYALQIKNFADNLPDRIKIEYLRYINPTHTNSNENGENKSAASIQQRRKSVQPIPEHFQSITTDTQHKLTRAQLDELHKCQPQTIYYEKKVPDDEKPTFDNSTSKNAYVRTLFNQLNEKKRHKFILKSIKLWEEYLESNPTIVTNHIPTIHLLLTKNDDIFYYFSSLGLPTRPPTTVTSLYNSERAENKTQPYWSDLPQTAKDEYIKRFAKVKAEYYEKFPDFVEKTLPSDYIRLEFFRNIKYASKDYEFSTKDRIPENDSKQSKITQYLTKENRDVREFDRIKQQLLETTLTSDQKNLVERLGQLMKKYVDDKNGSKTNNSGSKISTESTKLVQKQLADVIVINGDVSSDENVKVEETIKEKKKKHKRKRNDVDEIDTSTCQHVNEKQNTSSSSMKKRK